MLLKVINDESIQVFHCERYAWTSTSEFFVKIQVVTICIFDGSSQENKVPSGKSFFGRYF